MRLCLLSLVAALLVGCGTPLLPSAGPTANAIDPPLDRRIAVVELTPAVVGRLAQPQSTGFAALSSAPAPTLSIGPGDQLEVTLWEAAPALLFGSFADEPSASVSRATTLPPQMVAADGGISVPFAGTIAVTGRTPREVERAILAALQGQANRPQAIVRVVKPAALDVTVVGEVAASLRMPLTSRAERVLDAIAAAGGVKQPVEKATLQLVRGGHARSVTLEEVIRDPRQNVVLHPGDILTAYYQPLAFTALGAVAKSGEVAFEATGLTLAQALARAGGALDNRADASGLFVFRNEGDTPVIYRLDMLKPEAFFAMREFRMRDKDVLYVSNAPLADLQKLMTVVATIVYPATVTTNY